MRQLIKKAQRFFLRRYALLGAAFRFNKNDRNTFRERIDSRIIETFREDIEDFIAKYPKVLSEEETIRLIIDNRYSISRYGDGEFKLIIGERHKAFQDVNEELNRRMVEILNSTDDNILIGIQPVRNFDELGRVWQKFIIRIGKDVLKLLDADRTYPSTLAFRYIPTTDENTFIQRVKLIKRIWENRHILIVVGKNSRFTYEEEIFNNAKSVSFVYGPAKNAFLEYDNLISQIKKYDKNKYLVLCVLGPTATVMAYDLAKLGYQAIDFGQMPGLFRKAKKEIYGNECHPVKELQHTHPEQV